MGLIRALPCIDIIVMHSVLLKIKLIYKQHLPSACVTSEAIHFSLEVMKNENSWRAIDTKNGSRGSFSDGKMCYMSLEPE